MFKRFFKRFKKEENLVSICKKEMYFDYTDGCTVLELTEDEIKEAYERVRKTLLAPPSFIYNGRPKYLYYDVDDPFFKEMDRLYPDNNMCLAAA